MNALGSTSLQKRQWFDVGLATGVAASFAYAFGVFVPLPPRPQYLFFMAFGPLLCISSVGMYVFVREHRDTVSLQIGSLCLFCSGLMFTAMSTMQGSIIFQIREFIAQQDGSQTDLWRTIFRGTMATQLGLDFAFDIFISAGTFLVAYNVISHPRFKRSFGWLGMFVASTGLVFNAVTFPENAGEAGLLDPAPFFGVWFGLFVLVFGGSRRWFAGQLLSQAKAPSEIPPPHLAS